MLYTALEMIPDDIKQTFRAESYSGIFSLSYLYVTHPDKPKVSGFGYIKCTKPTCNNHSKSKCARCTVPYCSTICQRDHYKEHRSYCLAATTTPTRIDNTTSNHTSTNTNDLNRTSVLIDTLLYENGAKDKSFQTCFSMNGSGYISNNKQTGKVHLKHINGEIIVKIQGHVAPSCKFIIYDELRRINTSLQSSESIPGQMIYNYLQNKTLPYQGIIDNIYICYKIYIY